MDLQNWPWEPQPDYTRLLNTLRRQGDPGNVPFLELFADREVIAAALDEPTVPAEALSTRAALEASLDQKIRFWYQLGYDAFWQGPLLDLPQTRLEEEDTAALSKGQRRWVDEHAGIITNWSEFKSYPWPDPALADYYPLEYVAEHLPAGMAIIAQIGGILEPVMWLMGYETFALALYDQRDLIEAMFQKVAELRRPIARNLVQMDRVMALWMGDDMGFKTGTMISHADLREFVFPLQREIASIAHDAGMPFLLHSCGNLEAVMPDLIQEVGIDAKHSFEDAFEPVEVFLNRYSDEIAVIGGIDVDILARGTEAQVRRRTRKVLERCAPSGAYVLGSGNSIANYIPLSNFLAMVDEGHRFNS